VVRLLRMTRDASLICARKVDGAKFPDVVRRNENPEA